jgi:hypothetical protein
MIKMILCLISLGMVACSSNSQPANISYIDSNIDSNNEVILHFSANKDFGKREHNESGSYVFCLLKNPDQMDLNDYIPDFSSEALHGVIPRNQNAFYNQSTKLYEYEVILMKTVNFDLINLNSSIFCRVFTGRVSGGFGKSNNIEVVNPFKKLRK